MRMQYMREIEGVCDVERDCVRDITVGDQGGVRLGAFDIFLHGWAGYIFCAAGMGGLFFYGECFAR